jgi:hypothetical protein
MSTGPAERANDARETNKNRWKEPPWTARRTSWNEAVGVNSVGARVSGSGLAVPGAGCFPRTICGHGRGRSCRSAHQAAPGARRAQGGGGGAARKCAGRRPGPCGLARVAGRGRVGVGNERHAFAIAKDLKPVASCFSCCEERRLPTLVNLYLQPASNSRSVHLSLLFRVFASGRRATSWSPACRGAERVASPCLPRIFRYLAPRQRTWVVEF